MGIVDRIHDLQATVPSDVTIVLATKYASVSDIGMISHAFPSVVFGENRVQHGKEKQDAHPTIPNPWHFIGHIQRNKVATVIDRYDLIHSVDSQRLLTEINRVAQKKNQRCDVLLQVNLNEDKSKFGFNQDAIWNIVEILGTMNYINICGLMCMAPHIDDMVSVGRVFKMTRRLYDDLNGREGLTLRHLSMGMSHDYDVAINEGANMIRVGRKVFE